MKSKQADVVSSGFYFLPLLVGWIVMGRGEERFILNGCS